MSTTVALLTCYLTAFGAILGYINHINLSNVLPTFKQNADCKTTSIKTLDVLYANTTEAYNSISLQPLSTLSISCPG